jgi:hypothetical protein
VGSGQLNTADLTCALDGWLDVVVVGNARERRWWLFPDRAPCCDSRTPPLLLVDQAPVGTTTLTRRSSRRRCVRTMLDYAVCNFALVRIVCVLAPAASCVVVRELG